MKSTISIRQAVSAIILLWGAAAIACGPYYPIIPTPEFFIAGKPHKTMADYDRDENLRLWQELTSKQIPLSDIEKVVYSDSLDKFREMTGYYEFYEYSFIGEYYDPDIPNTDNLFYIYLANTSDYEIINFIMTAKDLERCRNMMNSPWYYPRERDSYGDSDDNLDKITSRCLKYDGNRLRDRYALQATRALFASRRYGDCIEYYDSAFSTIPDNNLMKRMAQRYVAGCWNRLGEKARADSIFAEAGDIWSISDTDPIGYMACHNPNAPQLMEYIRDKRCARDTTLMRNAAKTAESLLADNKVSNKGDWNFMLAYVNNKFNDNTQLARKQIYNSLQQKFSSDELHDLARAYKMKLDAKTGNIQSLRADLQWAEGQLDPLNADASEWERRIRNIIYEDWVPGLWNKKDYSTAIMLCSYADNIGMATRYRATYPSVGDRFQIPADYSNLSFQLMGSLTSAELATVYDKIRQSNPLYDFLRKNVRTDSDYYYEVTGTLALREGDYARAEKYLSQVGKEYQLGMNINRYLSRDAFKVYPTRWTIEPASFGYEEWAYDRQAVDHDEHPTVDAKLDFSRKMIAYKNKMEHGRNNDERGEAALMYAIGRRNSLEECWALTQYWRGECCGLFSPQLEYWEEDFAEEKYSFLYDYSSAKDYKKTEAEYNMGIEAALAMLESDEAKAKAEYILGNLKTVVARYGDTTTGRFVKTSCDRWKQWI